MHWSVASFFAILSGTGNLEESIPNNVLLIQKYTLPAAWCISLFPLVFHKLKESNLESSSFIAN